LLAEARFYEKIIKNVADCLPDYQPASGILLLIQAVEEKMSALIKKLLNYLLIGILAVIPIVLILQIIIFVKDRVADLFQLVYGYSVSYVYTSLIFAVSFIILVSIGRQIAKQGRPWFIAAFEHVIERIPFLNTVYRVIKKVINMFSSHDKSIAKEVVYVEYPKDGIWVPAYVTNRFNEKYVLFVPTSPNPTSGFTVIVDKSKIIRSNMNIEEATSFIVSVGVDFNKDTEVSQLPR
jgi:uncharacterized membrane protein